MKQTKVCLILCWKIFLGMFVNLVISPEAAVEWSYSVKPCLFATWPWDCRNIWTRMIMPSAQKWGHERTQVKQSSWQTLRSSIDPLPQSLRRNLLPQTALHHQAEIKAQGVCLLGASLIKPVFVSPLGHLAIPPPLPWLEDSFLSFTVVTSLTYTVVIKDSSISLCK